MDALVVFIHSSDYEHLCCFCVLDIVNKGTVSMEAHILQDQILISILLDRHKLYSPTHWLICSTKIYGVPSVCQAWTQSWIAACLTQEELEKIDTLRPAFLIVTMSAGPQSNNSMSSMEHGKWEALSTPGNAGNLEQEEKAFKSNLRVQRHWWMTLSPCVSVSSSVKWG